jgi:hypothetical protein
MHSTGFSSPAHRCLRGKAVQQTIHDVMGLELRLVPQK